MNAKRCKALEKPQIILYNVRIVSFLREDKKMENTKEKQTLNFFACDL